MDTLSKLTSKVYSSLSDFKNVLYDNDIIGRIKIRAKVISIGNITVGGTGKTPICQLFLDYLTSKNIKIALVAKSYKADLDHSEKVNTATPSAARLYGDEITMLANRNPSVNCYSGPKKWKSALLAQQDCKPKVVLIDDGFQHRKIFRDLDIVLLDATDEMQVYEPLPFGMAREGFSSLKRADWLIITKSNLVSGQKLQDLMERIPQKKPVTQIEYHLNTNIELKDKKILAICGISKPHIWLQMLKMLNPNKIQELIFSDHFNYDQSTIEEIEKLYISSQSELVVVTEKDYIKLKEMWPTEIPIVVTQLELRASTQSSLDKLYRKIDELIS